MTAYDLMIKTNHHIIKGGELTDAQKANIVGKLLAARSDERTKKSFYKGVKYPNNVDNDGGGRMYPEYFIPPYNNGKKLQTVIPMTPKTHILSANSYELEIIRILFLFAPDDSVVKDMVKWTIERLTTTCFGYHDCAIGECFHSALPVLRFLAAAATDETTWINKLITFFNKHIDEKLRNKRCHGNMVWYYWLCLSELPYEISEPELLKYKNEFCARLMRSAVMNSESDKIHQPVLCCVLRNCLCRFLEYAYIKDRQPYVSEKDGRLHFDINFHK